MNSSVTHVHCLVFVCCNFGDLTRVDKENFYMVVGVGPRGPPQTWSMAHVRGPRFLTTFFCFLGGII